MSKAIYPGSFDPITFGHIDIIERASKIVDELVVGVLCNSAKNPLFSLDERVSMIEEMTKHLPNVTVQAFDGLLVDYMNKIGATLIVRGLRAVTDFEYELQIAQTNPHFSSVDGVLYNKDQSKMLFYPIGKKGELTLPDNLRKLNYQLKTNKLTSIQVTANNSKFTSVDGVLYDNRTRKMLCYPLYKGTYRIPKSVNDVNYLYQIQDIVKLKSIQVSGKNNKFYAKDGVLFSNSNDTLLYYPPQKAGAYVVPESTAYIDPDAFNYAKKLTKLTISKNVSRHAYTTYSFENCSNLQEIVVKQGKLNSINMSFWYCDKLKKITLPSSIMTMNMYGLPEGVTIYGWNNTKAKSIAKKAKCKFVSLGTIPNKVSGIRVKKIIDKYQISWNASSNVSGYQVYTKYETIADIKGSSNTKCNIKDIEDYDTIYIRAYTIKNKKKIYGKAAKYSVR